MHTAVNRKVDDSWHETLLAGKNRKAVFLLELLPGALKLCSLV